MSDGLHGPPVPRPVAGVPPAALAGGDVVAKGWLLEVLAAAPLADAHSVPVAGLADRGPALCAAVLEAVGSADALARLGPGGDRAVLAAETAALAGASDPVAAARAVAALRRALWAALAREAAAAGPPDAGATAALAERVAHVGDVLLAAVLAEPAGPAADLADAEEPWRPAVERALSGGAPFALLAVEAADAERLLAAGGADAAALAAVEPAVRGAVRAGDTVVRERPGRLWVVAPAPDAAAARPLAEAIVAAVAGAAAPHGVPLQAAAGIAAFPGDGDDAGALAACADERLFAAQAAGATVR
jgi:GGDEF domain-containing protein